jgi:mitochondrial chaperone BCS1
MDFFVPYNTDGIQQSASSWNDWSGISITRIMGFSFFASLLSSTKLLESAKLLFLGSLVETGRRLFQWLIERFRLREFEFAFLFVWVVESEMPQSIP